MFTGTLGRHRTRVTILLTLGWLISMLCWLALAWRRYSLFQGLAGLGISTLLFAAIVGVLWAAGRNLAPAATILTTLGWLSFALYWIGFAWRRHTLLANGATLMLTLLTCLGIVTVLWLRRPADAWR
jgi:hypothetical protein